MLKVNKMIPPSGAQWNAVIKGMRLPMKSGEKSDSRVAQVVGEQFIFGDADKRLAISLVKAGSSDRKFLRQLPVIMEINAPLYWWKQMDKYQLATTTSSESSMHTMLKEKLAKDDFSVEATYSEEAEYHQPGKIHICPECRKEFLYPVDEMFEDLLCGLNDCIERADGTSDPDEKRLFEKIVYELLPESYNQTRCWSANYEVLINIIQQRRGHKLGEWKTFIDYCLENVPYLKEFFEAAENHKKVVSKLVDEFMALSEEKDKLRERLGEEE